MRSDSWRVTPAAFLNEIGWQFKQKGKWLAMQLCPFCQGGDHRDKQTFIVHATDGNYSCSRSKCGVRGTFWGLIEVVGLTPSDYFADAEPTKRRERKKGYIYGR